MDLADQVLAVVVLPQHKMKMPVHLGVLPRLQQARLQLTEGMILPLHTITYTPPMYLPFCYKRLVFPIVK